MRVSMCQKCIKEGCYILLWIRHKSSIWHHLLEFLWTSKIYFSFVNKYTLYIFGVLNILCVRNTKYYSNLPFMHLLRKNTLKDVVPLWRHDMKTLSALLAPCASIKSPVDSPHREPVVRSFDVFFVVTLHKLRVELSVVLTSCRRHQMETFSALLAGEFPAQRLSFDVFFDLRLNKRLSKHSWGWWFETQSSSLWRHCNDAILTSMLCVSEVHIIETTHSIINIPYD